MINFKSPILLDSHHQHGQFDCGTLALNDYLKKHALHNNRNGSSRTYVSLKLNDVCGYYSLTPGSISKEFAPKRVSIGLASHPVPIIIITRLAVDINYQGMGLGKSLLFDALLRIVSASEIIGGRAVFVQAKDEHAMKFYKNFDFEQSPANPLHLFLLIKDIKKNLER